MRSALGEPIGLDDLARAAGLSKFHFARSFQQVTGLSPGRFLSALRLARAKELLLHSPHTVAEVSASVGYAAVGTFSTRFTASVGLPPSVYRQRNGIGAGLIPIGTGTAHVHGRVPRCPGRIVFLGLFPTRLPHGKPAACAVLDGGGAFTLSDAPAGQWWLLAQSVRVDQLGEPAADAHVATVGPLRLAHCRQLEVGVQTTPATLLDPPVLVALRDLG
jgi:AraC-like DNA-binding protein